MTTGKAIPEIDMDELFERSKDDHAMIVGSEIRQVIGRARRAEAALSEARDDLGVQKSLYQAACKRADQATGELRIAAEVESHRKQLIEQVTQQAATISQLTEIVRLFRDRIEDHGEWDDGCFYHNKCSASELEQPLQMASTFLAPKPFKRKQPYAK